MNKAKNIFRRVLFSLLFIPCLVASVVIGFPVLSLYVVVYWIIIGEVKDPFTNIWGPTMEKMMTYRLSPEDR